MKIHHENSTPGYYQFIVLKDETKEGKIVYHWHTFYDRKMTYLDKYVDGVRDKWPGELNCVVEFDHKNPARSVDKFYKLLILK